MDTATTTGERVTAGGRRSVHATQPQGVSFVELFFDLVFVFAVTQITALTAHDLTATGLLRSVLIGWLIWWAWTQFTWTLNPADTSQISVRVVTLVATAAAFIMAASVPRAFTDEAIWFAIPYVVVRLLGLGLQVRVEIEHQGEDHRGVYRWASFSLIGLALVLLGAVVDTEMRSVVWLLAIVADFIAAAIAGRATTWDMDPAHMSERHGLFVIIALGESLIVAAAAVAEAPLSPALILAVGASVVVACLLWWTYFGWLKDALEHRFAAADPRRRGSLARDAFSLAHFPLIGGIVGFAVAVEETVLHPADPMPGLVLAALGIGVALVRRLLRPLAAHPGGPVLVPRLVALAVMVVGLAVAGAIAAPPWMTFGVVAVALMAIVLSEARTPVEA